MSRHLRSAAHPHHRDMARARSTLAGRTAGVVGILLTTLASAVGTASAGERRVVIGRDGREPLSERGARAHVATGLVECGGMRGIGQVTGADDVVTTAAHVFFDEAGRPRSERGDCVFVVDGPAGRLRVPLAPDARLCGSTTPYGVSGRHDWAVARLAHPIPGVRAYAVGGRVAAGDAILVVAWEHGVKTSQVCRVRDVIESEGGAHEIRTDCTGFDGMSGAAYLTVGGSPSVIGVHVGYRSADPDRVDVYSDRHHTFGSAIGTVFRRALARARGH